MVDLGGRRSLIVGPSFIPLLLADIVGSTLRLWNRTDGRCKRATLCSNQHSVCHAVFSFMWNVLDLLEDFEYLGKRGRMMDADRYAR